MRNKNITLLPCPFCGKDVDSNKQYTLHPNGIGWMFDEELEVRTYHKKNEVPTEQWCWIVNCPACDGGCGAEIHGDSMEEAVARWNIRYRERNK